MHKKAKVVAVVLGLMVLLWAISQFVRLPFLGVHPHDAIPSHTALFFSLSKTQLQQVANGASPQFLDEIFFPKTLRDELIDYEANFGEHLPFPEEGKIFVTVNPTRGSGIDLLFILPNCRATKLEEALNQDPDNRVRSSNFQSWDVFTVYRGDKQFSFAKYRNLLLLARHAYLVENAISQLKSPGTSICEDPAFCASKQRIGKKSKGEEGFEIVLNMREFGAQFAPLIESSELSTINLSGKVFSWARIWYSPKTDAATWSMSVVQNEEHPILKANQSSAKSEVNEVHSFLPDDLTAFVWFGQKGFSPATNAAVWNDYFAAWAGTSVTLAIGEQLGNAPAEKFLLLHSTDAEGAEASLEKLAEKFQWEEPAEFQMFKIWNLTGIDISKIFGLGESMRNGYAAMLGDYVLFSNSKSGVERWLVKYLAGQTFAQNADFLKSNINLPTPTQVLFYMESGRAWQIANQFLNENRGSFFGANPLVFNHLVGAGSWKGKCLTSQLITPINEQKEKGPASILWQLPLAAEAEGAPLISVNPESEEAEILAKDAAHNVYLISDNGRIIWQRRIDEPILSDLAEIDLRNDDERQFVFSTRSAIYILDESGRDVAGYPLRLQIPASNGVAVVDFFQSNDYRFFIACENGNAYGFDERGSPIEGWRPNAEVGIVRQPLLHFQAKGMDFLCLLNESGELLVFQKNGNFRFPKVEFDTPFLQGLDHQSHPLSSRIVTADETGLVYITNLIGDHFRLNLKVGNNEGVKFAFGDVVGDTRKDYIVAGGKELATYYYRGNAFEKAFSHRFSSPPSEVFSLHYPGGKKQNIGVVNKDKKRIYLMDGRGEIATNFPLEGTTPFVVGDLLKNGRLVTVTGSGRSICAYALD